MTNERPLVLDTTERPLRAAIYARVSTMGQVNTSREEDGYSIPAQVEAAHHRAASLGAEVVAEYIDRGESARSAKRPELQRLLERLKAQRDLDYVIVHKIDRLARNRTDDVMINVVIREAGARLVSVSENVDETPTGKLLYGIMADFAEYYSANLAHEMSKKMAQKAKQGETPYKAPIGYLNVREVIDNKVIRTIATDPDRATLIRWAFTEYATGAYTITQLHEQLVARGLTTRESARTGGRPISRSLLGTVLRNRYYLGFVSFQGVEYQGRHEPLVDHPTFERVQALLDSNRQGEKQRIHQHYLRSTIVCARCHGRLCHGRSRGRGGYYEYFFCINHQKGRNTCALPNLRVEAIEDAIIDYYAKLRVPEPIARRLRDLVSNALESQRRHADEERTRQNRLFGFQRGVMVVSRSQLGLPA